MNKQIWSKSVPHLVAILFFIIVSYIYFSPVIEGKVVIGHDNQTWAGMSKETMDYNATHKTPTLWTNSMFGGMPTYQIAMKTPADAVSFIYSFFTVFPRPVYYLILYLIGFYILMLALRINPWLSMIGAAAFAFASYNFIIIAAGHSSKAITIAYMAPVIGSVVMAFRERRWLGAILTAIFLGLGIKAGHFQIVYYVLIIILILGISELIYSIKDKQFGDFLKTLGALGISLVLAVGINATTLLTTYEYGQYSMRGQGSSASQNHQSNKGGLDKDYITQWSYGIGETLTLLIPDFRGGASDGTLTENSATGQKLDALGADASQIMSTQKWPLYWGNQPMTSGPVYVGAIVCFLFVLGLFLVEGRYKWWLLAATILSVMLAWGKNFGLMTDFFIDHVPMYNKFRTVSMILVIAGYTMPILAVLAIQRIVKGEYDQEKFKKALYWSLGITGGLSLLFALIPSLAGNFMSPSDNQFTGNYAFLQNTLPIDRESLLRSDAFRSFIFILLAGAAIWLFTKKKINTSWLYISLGVLILLDMYPVAKRYLNDSNFESKTVAASIKPSVADKAILQDTTYYRVLNLSVSPFNDASTSYFHKSIGGYHGAKLREYQDLIDAQLIPEIESIFSSFKQAKTAADIQQPLAAQVVLNMLDMKYLIYDPQAPPILNPYANGSQWLIRKVVTVPDQAAALQKVGQIDTKHEAVVTQSVATTLPSSFGSDTTATITLQKYEPNKLVYDYQSKSPQIAVFSEIYYPKGWNAYIDGKKVPFVKADYLLRAMALNAGQYQIMFRFDPKSYSLGNAISMISSILLILFVLGGLFLLFRKCRKKREQ
ncbi:YfhO family protein [Microbacter margulisiae]|uniref:Membrane protein YfhO n=1 Tax=Microbacter margulisiae TaxID=1350067 RepID=A0A7W5H2H2_9PORP|nr:YfhO family protein [Microbacter margulisiae]MBB3187745.1 hypothetical protein [Microbacter margulisiae]MBB3188777.1 hypothetical protein [Microbacter margulisiae]